MKYKKNLLPLPKVPKNVKKEAIKKAMEKYKKDKNGNVSKNVKPFEPRPLPTNPKPKPMPKPPSVNRPIGRPVPARPGMTYRKGLASMQKQRVLARLKKMKENA